MTQVTKYHKHAAALLSIIATGVVAYLPAVDNFFISDDFGMFTFIQTVEKNPRWFFESTIEFFRLMSHIYFAGCFKLFGLNPEAYYWAGIALHGIVSVLTYLLVLQLTRSLAAAWAAGIFFAAYERHHEAVMWISAANETILALNCIVFLLLWRRSSDSGGTVYCVLAHIMFVLALFSKEAAVVLIPMAALQLLLAGYSLRAVLRKSAGLLVLLAAFGAVWLATSHRNFFVTDGHYAFGWHFVPVYTRSLVRLLTQVIPVLVAWIATQKRQSHQSLLQEMVGISAGPWHKSPILLFAALLVLAIAPYSFLTYLNHIPSRNTYLPSVALAGLVGIFFASLYGHMGSEWTKRVCVLFFGAIVTANVAYIWLKKEPQFRERAAPTRELIRVLNQLDVRDLRQFSINVCRFPLDQGTFTEVVTRFTRFNATEVALADSCDVGGNAVMKWDQRTGTYIADFAKLSVERNYIDPVAAK